MSTTTDDDAPRPGRGRPSAPVLLLLAVVVVLAVVVAFLAGRSGGGTEVGAGTGGAEGSAGSAGSAGAGTDGAPTSTSEADSCVPGPEHPAPTIDLGVQPSTGRDLLPVAEVQRLVGLARDAGASVISTAVSWRYLQPRASTASADFRYRGLDSVVDAARAEGLQVRVQLIGIPQWASDRPDTWTRTTPPTSPAELARWSTFVGQLAAHVAGDVDYLEIWNEPNNEVYWPDGPEAAGFARLLAASYGPAKAAAPDLQVISGGLVSNDVGYLSTLYQAIEDLGISPRPFDLVGSHPFTGSASPLAVDASRRYERSPFGLVDDNFTGFASLHQVVQDRGDTDVDLYITAFGYGTGQRGDQPAVTDATRATYATEALEIVTCTPYIRAFSWYYLHPTPFDPVRWTLLDEQLRPTQTYEAFTAWAAQAADAVATTP